MLVTIFEIDIGSLIVQDWVFGLQQIGARQAVNQGGGEDGPSSARTLPPAHHLEPSWPPSSSDKVQPVTPSCATDTCSLQTHRRFGSYCHGNTSGGSWHFYGRQWGLLWPFVVLLLFFAPAPSASRLSCLLTVTTRWLHPCSTLPCAKWTPDTLLSWHVRPCCLDMSASTDS